MPFEAGGRGRSCTAGPTCCRSSPLMLSHSGQGREGSSPHGMTLHFQLPRHQAVPCPGLLTERRRRAWTRPLGLLHRRDHIEQAFLRLLKLVSADDEIIVCVDRIAPFLHRDAICVFPKKLHISAVPAAEAVAPSVHPRPSIHIGNNKYPRGTASRRVFRLPHIPWGRFCCTSHPNLARRAVNLLLGRDRGN